MAETQQVSIMTADQKLFGYQDPADFSCGENKWQGVQAHVSHHNNNGPFEGQFEGIHDVFLDIVKLSRELTSAWHIVGAVLIVNL